MRNKSYIRYIFTNNNKIGSRLISWITKKGGQKYSEVPSHFAVEFFDTFIVESRFESGVSIDFIDAFKKRNKIIGCYANKKDITPREAKWLLKKVLKAIYGSKYDWKSLIYFGYRLLLHKWFNSDLPKINKAENKNRNFCTEVYEIISNKEMSMMSPNRLMREMDLDDSIVGLSNE